MTLTEYKERLLELKKKADREELSLASAYALAHSEVKIGDFLQDHHSKIKVEQIKIYRANPPSCVYYGTQYTKANKPRKDKLKRAIYQINIPESE